MRLLMEICEELRMRVLGEKLKAENESSGRKMRFSNKIFNNECLSD